ncbi:hypothetical protein ORD22_03910 [Sporosarcina sp. GW1-11]|uniref:hypothetical protein n=1 Tax=Sporosarcina sp. GW1-11 TaxID=2899126 RepID=UPI00294D155D|nr:hypothetical protein [Sporosarcina sp. GW1-11]MDV6377408.1 hypothetical protein [Sporosarcina sp. GW1-11]
MNSSNEELLVDYIVACTNLYGVTPFDHVHSIYNEQNEDQISLEDLTTTVNSIAIKEILEERFVYVQSNEFVSEAIRMPKEKQRLKEVVMGKPYYVPDQAELLRFVDEQYIQHTPQQEHLKNMLREDFGESYPVDEEVEGLVYSLQVSGGDFSTILSMFLDDLQLPIQRAERYIPVIVEIAETTRMWEHRGHTQNELLK